jgi:ACS family hexuronate transporter-like MFS transporter
VLSNPPVHADPATSAATTNSSRWWILSLLFFATTINYLDRAILGVLLPEIQKELNFSQEAYGNIQFWFQFAYGIGSLVGGKVLDTYGTRIGYGLAAAIWSVAGALHSLATGAFHFGALRMLLGLSEAPNFPACNKAVAEAFPPAQRAFAMGLVNSGPNVANVIGPPLFAFITITWGWRTGFLLMGVLGFLWLPAWLFSMPKASAPAAPRARLNFGAVLQHKPAWAYAAGKFLTDPVWWFYLFWLPTYLTTVRGMTLEQRVTALAIVYAISAFGSVAGGALSSYLMKLGWHISRARKTTMLACAIVMPLSALGMVVENTNLAILLFGLGTAAHQAWSANLFTLPSDVFPQQSVGTANSIGVFTGAMGGALFSGLVPGYLLGPIGYTPILITMSCFYLIAWGLIDRWMGDFSPVQTQQ